MGERHSREPRDATDRTAARRLTDDLRAAVADPRTSALELTARVGAAHRGRVWAVLGHGSWGAYAMAELGVARPTAYRLLDLAAAAEAVEATVAREVGPSVAHVWDNWPVLSVQAVVELRGRLAELTDLLAERLAPLRPAEGGAPPDPAQIGTAVADAVAELRERPDVPPADLRIVRAPEGWEVEAWRAVVTEGLNAQERVLGGFRDLGLLALRMAPGYLSDHDAEPVLHLLGKETGSTCEELLACRRYALTGDPRAIEGR